MQKHLFFEQWHYFCASFTFSHMYGKLNRIFKVLQRNILSCIQTWCDCSWIQEKAFACRKKCKSDEVIVKHHKKHSLYKQQYIDCGELHPTSITKFFVSHYQICHGDSWHMLGYNWEIHLVSIVFRSTFWTCAS